MIARLSARQITLTLSEDSEVFLVARAGIGDSSCRCHLYLARRPAI